MFLTPKYKAFENSDGGKVVRWWRGYGSGDDVVVVEMVCRGDGSGGGVGSDGVRWEGSDGVGLELMRVASTAGGRRGCASVVVGRRWPKSGRKMGKEEMEAML
ncbi:hypothetical protein Tco_0492793 [Tanacetum coccineum]